MEEHDAVPVWDDATFRACVERLARAQGRDLREVCRTAGVAHDYLDKHASRSGRSIGQLLKLAASLGVPVSVLVDAGTPGAEAALQATRDTLGRLALAANVAAHLYVNLDARGRAPVSLDAEEIVRRIFELMNMPAPGSTPRPGAAAAPPTAPG